LLLGFSSLCTLIGGIRVLGVPLDSFSFTSSFFQDVLDDDVQHIDAFLRLGDVQMTFGIFIHCFI
jgi:hypothetical protein